jgi:type IV pilus assembly protein PilY1
MASLGGTGVAGARRFFATPDLALIKCQGRNWLNVSVGSGNRESPITDKSTQDRIYSLRDFSILAPVNWSTYTVIKDVKVDSSSAMIDITPVTNAGVTTQAAVGSNATGWQLDLAVAAADAGEKVIVESRTFENAVFFTSFVPKVRADNNIVCTEAIGYNYLYVLNVCDGKVNSQFLAQMGLPVVAQGLAGQLNQKGIAPEVAFLFPSPDNASGSGTKRPPPVCLVGAEACGQFSGYAPKRTFWQQKAAD